MSQARVAREWERRFKQAHTRIRRLDLSKLLDNEGLPKLVAGVVLVCGDPVPHEVRVRLVPVVGPARCSLLVVRVFNAGERPEDITSAFSREGGHPVYDNSSLMMANMWQARGRESRLTRRGWRRSRSRGGCREGEREGDGNASRQHRWGSDAPCRLVCPDLWFARKSCPVDSAHAPPTSWSLPCDQSVMA